MPNIKVLDQTTINQIAAGEVVERPASVVKELLENAIDAKATAVTIEIKEGGIGFIRVTDNGCGIPRDEISTAFLRHATSKIQTVEDLFTVASLGFRGEALSSIASIAQVELITKTGDALSGSRYCIDGGEEKSLEEVGAPEGTTFLVRNLFYNTPARRKFLKSPTTEGAHIADLVEKIALSHPEVSIRFIQNGQSRLHTSGNHNLRDIIYTVYGREIAANLLPVEMGEEPVKLSGFIGKPLIARGNRNFETYFINGRYIKSSLISKAVEDAYKPFMMQHKYPFTMLNFAIDPSFLDVNVHPAKMELRFRDGEMIYKMVYHTISMALSERELIPGVELGQTQKKEAPLKPVHVQRPEPFEEKRREAVQASETFKTFKASAPVFETRTSDRVLDPGEGLRSQKTVIREAEPEYGRAAGQTVRQEEKERENKNQKSLFQKDKIQKDENLKKPQEPQEPRQMDLFEDRLLTREARAEHRLIGQLFDTYWLVEYRDKLYIIDQHAAHEKVLYEKTMATLKSSRAEHRLIGQLFDTYWLVEYRDKLYIIDQHAAHEKVLYEKTMATLKSREYTSQLVSPPVILTLNDSEQLLLERYMDHFTGIGFEIEPFGGREYAVRAVPANLFSIAKKDLLMEMLDSLSEEAERSGADMINDRIASMSCKAAVKGNHHLSASEAETLIDELLELENPYACPHGRPTIISMSRYELEKKFKRIV